MKAVTRGPLAADSHHAGVVTVADATFASASKTAGVGAPPPYLIVGPSLFQDASDLEVRGRPGVRGQRQLLSPGGRRRLPGPGRDPRALPDLQLASLRVGRAPSGQDGPASPT